ncbi:hypothetical protein Aperf_G00000059149 [Anoplocephala perfoliata]
MQKNILCFLLLIVIVSAVSRWRRSSEPLVTDTDISIKGSTDDPTLSEESKGSYTTESVTLLTSSQDKSNTESTYPQFQEQQEITTESEPIEGHVMKTNSQEEMLESIPQTDASESIAEATTQPEIDHSETEGNGSMETEIIENEPQVGIQTEISEAGATDGEQDSNELTTEGTYPQFEEREEMTTESEPIEGHVMKTNSQEEMLESIPQTDASESIAEATTQPEIDHSETEGNGSMETEIIENEPQVGIQTEISEAGATDGEQDSNELTTEGTYPQFEERQEMTTESEPLGHTVEVNSQEEMPKSTPQVGDSEDKVEASIQSEIHYPITEGYYTIERGSEENEPQVGTHAEVSEAEDIEWITEPPFDKTKPSETAHQVEDAGSTAELLGTVEESKSTTENMVEISTENSQNVSFNVKLETTDAESTAEEFVSQLDFQNIDASVPETEVEGTTITPEIIPTKAELPTTVTEVTETAEGKRLQETSMETEESTFVPEANENFQDRSEFPESLNQEVVQGNPIESTLYSTDASFQIGLGEEETERTTIQPQNDEALSDSTDWIIPLRTSAQMIDVDKWIESTDTEHFQPEMDDREAQENATETPAIEGTTENVSGSSTPEGVIFIPQTVAGADAGDIRSPSSSATFESPDFVSDVYSTHKEVEDDESSELNPEPTVIYAPQTRSTDSTEHTSNANVDWIEPETAPMKFPGEITIQPVDNFDISDETTDKTTETGDLGRASLENSAGKTEQPPSWRNNNFAAPNTTSGTSTLRFSFAMASLLILSQILLRV